MECIVGQTLHDKIKRVGALKVEEIIRISRQMAEGLAAAHKRGLIHRDIKPANILLENGVERVKITDFGLARTTSDGGSLTPERFSAHHNACRPNRLAAKSSTSAATCLVLAASCTRCVPG